MDKQILRTKYKQLRQTLSSEDIIKNSHAITKNFETMPIWQHHFFHLFLSIKKMKEVDTNPIINLLKSKKKRIVVSKTDFKNHRMVHVLLTQQTHLKNNTFGILEPVNGQTIDPKTLDVVILPLLAFDQYGARAGYGKGFYDNFLTSCKSNVLKIGLSMFEAEPLITTENHDVPLDYCVSPSRVYSFTKNKNTT